MWPFKKQEVDIVTIPDAVWANSTALKISKQQETKDTKALLRDISKNIQDAASIGKMKIHISRRWLSVNYTTPHWVLHENVKNALVPYGYKVDKGTNADYYIIIEWGETPKCTDLTTVKFGPDIRNKKDNGE